MTTDPHPGIEPDARARDIMLDGLARRYGRALSQYFQRRTANRADVPDLVQEVFVGLSRMKDPASIEKPETFLFVIAANVLRDRRRRALTHHAQAHHSYNDEHDLGSDFSPQRVLEARDEIAVIHASLADLPIRTRDAFVLRAFEELAMREVAAALGVSTRSAEKHYAKALVHITAALEGPRHPHRG